MSGSSTPQPLTSFGGAQSTVPLTDAEKSDIRFFCGYSLYGNSASGFMGYRFFEAQGFLEYRMTNASPNECASIRQQLTEIQSLRTAIFGASSSLIVDSAGVFKRNANEIRERKGLYDDWRIQLCKNLGVPPGPGIQSAHAGRIVI